VGCTREREPLRKEIEELRREEPLELERGRRRAYSGHCFAASVAPGSSLRYSVAFRSTRERSSNCCNVIRAAFSPESKISIPESVTSTVSVVAPTFKSTFTGWKLHPL